MKSIILLFGEMGAGKTYWGMQIAADNPGLRFIEGDQYVPEDMAACVRQFKFATRLQIRQLMAGMVRGVDEHLQEVPGVIISQALYRDEDRRNLIRHWRRQGHDVTCVWVRVPFWQNLKHLLKRERGWRWVLYWLKNKPFFQKPTHRCL